MVVATPANTAQTRRCPGCGGDQYIYIMLLKSKLKMQHRFLVMGLIQIPGTLVRFWRCDTSTCMVSEDAGTKWVPAPIEDPEPVREHIVYRLRALREKGWRFFEWEK